MNTFLPTKRRTSSSKKTFSASFLKMAYGSIFALLLLMSGGVFGQITETFSSWTSRSAYIASNTQAGSGGTWSMTNFGVTPAGAASGTGSAGFVQLNASGGTIQLPNVASGGIGTFTIKMRVSSTASSPNLVLQKSVGGGAFSTINTFNSGLSTTGTTYTFDVNDTSNDIVLRLTAANRTFYIHDISTTTYSLTPSILLANNGTQITAANVTEGTTNHVLHKFQLGVTTANATLTGVGFTTAGGYDAADITNIKLRYSTDATLDAGDTTLSTLASPGVAGSKTFPSFTNQVINAAATGYFFITADIAGSGSSNGGNTISVNALATTDLTFSAGTKSGSTSAGGTQTIIGPSIMIQSDGTQVAMNLTENTTDNVIHKFQLWVTTANATLTGVDFTTGGGYDAADISNIKLRYSVNNTLDAGDATLSTLASPGAAGAKTFPSFTNQIINSGAVGYFFITADIASGASTGGNTISVNGITTGDLTFSSGTKSGSTATGITQTIVAPTIPTLTTDALTGFGSQCINETYGPNSFTITGAALTNAAVTVASLSGFTFSTTFGGTYTASLSLTQPGGSYSQVIYVNFSPIASTSYNGNIVIGGGGASNINVAVTGTGTLGLPTVSTVLASSITTTTAASGGSAVGSGCGTIASKGVVWDVSANPTIALGTKTNEGTGNSFYSSAITGLTANTNYNYRAYATNSNAVTSYGANATFTTLSKAPTAPIANTATINGFTASWTAPAGQGAAALTYTVKIYSNNTLTTQVGTAITGINTTSTVITSLSQNTTYYYTVEAVNETGSSAVASFTSGITTLSGPCLSDNFNTNYGNWTGGSGTYNNSGAGNTSNGVGFNDLNDDIITTIAITNAASIKFKGKASGTTSNYTIKIQTSSSGSGPWNDEATILANGSNSGNITTTWNDYNISFVNIGNYFIRFVQSARITGSFYLDDVDVYCGIPCQAPTVTFQATPVTAITTETVSLHGNVTDEGDFTINTRGFEYSVNSTMSAAATKSSPATATGTYTENITGLTPNTVYYYRALAINNCNPNKTGYSHTSNYPTFTTVHNAPSVGSGSGATSSSFVANWTAPTGGGSAAFTYEIEVDDDSNFGSVNFTANGITGISTLVNSGLTASTTYYYRVRAVNAGGNSAWSATSLGYATTAPAPEIKIKIGSTSIGFGINLSFGSQISGTTGSENTLIIENSGDAPLSVGALSISGTDAASFIITQPLSATVAAGGTTTFTVTFAPTTMGSKTAQLSLINGDADENPFLINLFGTGTANASSDIITDNTFTYATNIDYKNYITADITALNSVELGRFIIRDGGTGDADNVGTTLTNLGITVGNFANLERLAIYDGATEIAEMPATATTYFSGLSLFATDNGTKTFTVRGSFKQTVTDKQRITLTLASTTASSTGSEFTTINATTSTIGNDNTISVTADRLAFTTQPTNVGINTPMANVVVAAVDINNNKDADATGDISITSTGTMPVTPLTATLVNGAATFNNIVHSVAQTGRNLIAKKTGFTDLNSNLFDVTAIVYVTGDIVSTYDGTGLSYSSGWQYFNGSTLTNVPDNNGPESTTTTIATVYINHIVNGGGNAVKNYNCNFVIGNGGKLTLSDLETTPSTFIAASKRIEVLSGGTLQIDGDMGVNSTGKVIVRSGGTLIINSPKATNSHPMWTGEENFENGSTVIINNWKWDASASTRSLMNTSTDIKNNDGGYKFGNLIIDINPTDSFVLIGGGIGVIKLCQNDLEINNSSTNYVHGASNASTAGFEIGGNMIIYDGPFSFGANFSSGTNTYTHNFIINGNFNCESNDALKINYRSDGTNTLNGTVTFKGNVTIGSNISSITQDVSSSTRMNVIFEGGNALSPKFIDIAPTAVAIPMTINSGYRKLQNHDLNLNSVNGYTTSFTLKSGATLDFGLSSTNTALNIKSISGGVGTNAFIAENGSTLKITSDGGIASSGSTGNVQTTTRTFGLADYQYTGITNQFTGTGLPTSGAKITIANTGTAPTNEVLLTNESTSVSALEITNGVFNLNEKTLTGTNLSIAENATLKIVGTQSFPSFTNKTFHNNGIVEYGGSNQSIAALTSPTYTKLKVSGTGKKVLSGTSVEVGNNLNITSSLLEISEGQTLRVQNEITTVDTDATNGLFIKNGGSLVQIANVDNQSSNINVGKIKMERITKPMYRLDYTYWSAPVSGNTLVALSPNSPANKFFEWNPDAVSPAPNWVVITGGTAQMLPGKGYIIRAPTSGNGTDASNPASYTPYTGNFNGKPNNGTVTTPVRGPEKWNLIGNPYPSAIDAEKFLVDNATLDGTLYFWTHNTPLTEASGYGYSAGDYAAWNGTGSLATVEAPSDTDPADNKPKGFIAAGQSFFVKGLNDGNAVFTNSMRENANNMQFFRSSNTEKHRVWLNLKGAEKGFSQTLVGYISNATNGQDQRYDGVSFGGNAVTFYSVMENKNWSIQGRALPFTTADEVPLGYKTTLTGTLIINIDDRDGQLATQNIYLKDNLLNVVHNLTDGPYTFTSTPGTYDDRFVLRYLPGENLDNPSFEDQMDGLSIRKNNADIHINSSFENIDAVLIYDIMGRLLFEKEKCNTQTFKTSNVTQSEQMLIIKVRLNNGAVVTKKVW